MLRATSAAVVLSVSPFALAADIDAGKAKVAEVCAACHGANGISVGDAIPHLAGQRAVYLESQLKALKEGTRKNPIMNAIASQLTPVEMANVAAYFASLPGPAAGARSGLLASVTKSSVTFPEGYKESFVRYHTIDFPATKQVRWYYANDVAARAAREGRPLPQGSFLFAEVYAAKLDADGKPVSGADGHYVADKLLFYTSMAQGAGWGNGIPEMLRNGDWNYAVFGPDKQQRTTVNQAECLACHKPLAGVSYTFTLKELAAKK